MAINGIVQYTGEFLPDILMFTQAPILVWFDGTLIVLSYYPLNYVLIVSYVLVCLVALHG